LDLSFDILLKKKMMMIQARHKSRIFRRS